MKKDPDSKVTLVKVRISRGQKNFWRDLGYIFAIMLGICGMVGLLAAAKYSICRYEHTGAHDRCYASLFKGL